MVKKIPMILVVLVLILATLACRLPTFKSPVPTAEVVSDYDEEEEPTMGEEELPDVEEETFEPEETEEEGAVSEETRVLSDNGVEITLPNTYVLGDVEEDLAILVEGLKAMSEEDAEDIQELYDNNKDDVILWGYDTNSPATHQTSLLVMKNEEFAGMSLAIISTFANVLLGSEVDTIQQEQLTFGEREVLRFLTTGVNAGVETSQAVYLFNDSGKLWLIGFFTNSEQLEDRLPIFDAAVASFTVISVE